MQRITYYERQIIESGVRTGKKVRAIARSIGRDHRVVQREVNRNTGDGRPYSASSAEQMARERERKKNLHKLEKPQHAALRRYVVSKLKEDWSPEQIAGTLKEQRPPEAQGGDISHESVYQYIYGGEGQWEHLWPHLRKSRRRRQKRYARKPRKICIPERISIHTRGEEIDDKTTFGHWESDTLIPGLPYRERLSVQYERKSMLLRLNKINGMGAEETEQAIRKSIDTLPEYVWKSITFDNGTEGANHVRLRKDYGIATFFCDAYASWQKGGVENMNGLLRQYFPRHSSIALFTPKHIYAIQEKLNNRPRKSLNYLTPNQIIARETGQVGH